MKLTFLGHSAFQVEAAGVRLYIDPFVTGNPQAPYGPDRLPKADFIFVTHGHDDHVGDTIALAKRDGATVISTFEVANHLAAEGAPQVHGMHLGGTYRFPFGKVRCTLAFHGSGVPGGHAAGFAVNLGGKTLYHAGDTALFGDMALLGQLEAIDVALLPIGGNFTMDAGDARLAARLLKAKTIIPMHYSTWPLIEADPHAYAEAVSSQGQNALVLRPGESVQI